MEKRYTQDGLFVACGYYILGDSAQWTNVRKKVAVTLYRLLWWWWPYDNDYGAWWWWQRKKYLLLLVSYVLSCKIFNNDGWHGADCWIDCFIPAWKTMTWMKLNLLLLCRVVKEREDFQGRKKMVSSCLSSQVVVVIVSSLCNSRRHCFLKSCPLCMHAVCSHSLIHYWWMMMKMMVSFNFIITSPTNISH